MHEEYAKGKVKSLTFEWDSTERKWVSKDKELPEQFGYGDLDLKTVLSQVHFVSAAGCGSKELEKLVLFYVEPREEKEPDIRLMQENED